MNRRTFITASLATGLAAAPAAHAQVQAGAALGEEFRGRTKADLPTPALLVDLDRLESNLRTMAEHVQKAGCGLRPHAKTHKCPEIARRQIATGALGICVATVPEAEDMVAAGIRGVLLTSPIVERRKIARMAALAGKGDVLLAVGHPRQVELLSAAAEAAKATVSVLVDLDVGDRRTGMRPGEPALELARLIAKNKNLRLRGLQAYSGMASHTVGFERRDKVSRQAMQQAVETRDLFAKQRLEAGILSGGSTGTYNIDSTIRGVTELQVGSYVFMDVDYRRIGGRGNAALYDDFQPSLTVLTTVVSATHADRVTVDAGTKALDTTTPHRAQAKDRQGIVYGPAGDEFGALTAEKGVNLPRLGERLEFIVPHCDPTTNLYDRLYAARGDRVEAVWPVLARRER
ncbi:MAG: DSD1 family PLP-dependent enzyme [Gemmataceae bacterium]|nr:DSD1 family PLP-dependent enzyme [Gemmataceae bacterium]MCI0741237.1 DSD1 family PLP-dependent enzyme [Gemmataceae bacterium]